MTFVVGPQSRTRFARVLSKRAFATSARRTADNVRLVEVGPRDGLQNEKTSIPVETKLELVRKLASTGLKTIEAGSFVSPKWVPQVIILLDAPLDENYRKADSSQMASSDKILASIINKTPDSPVPITYQWLLPNTKGLKNFFAVLESTPPNASEGYPTPPSSPTTSSSGPALKTSSQDPNAMPASDFAADATSSPRIESIDPPRHEVSIFLAATESFSQRNTNCSIAESLERFRPIMADSRDNGVSVRAYISVALGCPFEGLDVDPHKVAELAASLLEMGADEISVADTTGMGTAPRTRELLRTLASAGIRNDDLALHFHDTFGQALVNTLVALEHGVRTFDSAVAGLGGCPYSPGATGNVATEDLVYMLHTLGVSTGVDLEAVSVIGEWITGEIGKSNESRAGKATLARLKRQDSR